MKDGIALAVAVVLGILGFVASYIVMSRSGGGAPGVQDPQAMTRVVVAKKDLKAGTRLEPGHLDTLDIPVEFCSAAHVEETEKNTILGRVLRTAVRQGEPILALALDSALVAAPVELEGQLRSPDTHAVAVEVDAPGSVGGLIKPGQKVDVIATFDLKFEHFVSDGQRSEDRERFEGSGEKSGEATITRTLLLLQNRTVLAVDVRTNSRYDGDPKAVQSHVVTLAVTAEEALKLALLQAKGRGHLALRSRSDSSSVTLPALGATELLKPRER